PQRVELLAAAELERAAVERADRFGIDRGEMPGIAARVELDHIEPAARRLAQDVAALERNLGKRLMRRSRERDHLGFVDEDAFAVFAGLEGDDRAFDRRVGSAEFGAADARAVQLGIEWLAEECEHTIDRQLLAGIDVLLDEHRSEPARMADGVLVG